MDRVAEAFIDSYEKGMRRRSLRLRSPCLFPLEKGKKKEIGKVIVFI